MLANRGKSLAFRIAPVFAVAVVAPGRFRLGGRDGGGHNIGKISAGGMMADSGQRLKTDPPNGATANGATGPGEDTSAPAGLAHLAGYSTSDIVAALEAHRPWFITLFDILLWPSIWLFWLPRCYPLVLFTMVFWYAAGLSFLQVLLAGAVAVVADKKLRSFMPPDPPITTMVDYLTLRRPVPKPSFWTRRKLVRVWCVISVLFVAALVVNYMALSYYLMHGLVYVCLVLLAVVVCRMAGQEATLYAEYNSWNWEQKCVTKDERSRALYSSISYVSPHRLPRFIIPILFIILFFACILVSYGYRDDFCCEVPISSNSDPGKFSGLPITYAISFWVFLSVLTAFFPTLHENGKVRYIAFRLKKLRLTPKLYARGVST